MGRYDSSKFFKTSFVSKIYKLCNMRKKDLYSALLEIRSNLYPLGSSLASFNAKIRAVLYDNNTALE